MIRITLLSTLALTTICLLIFLANAFINNDSTQVNNINSSTRSQSGTSQTTNKTSENIIRKNYLTF